MGIRVSESSPAMKRRRAGFGALAPDPAATDPDSGLNRAARVATAISVAGAVGASLGATVGLSASSSTARSVGWALAGAGVASIGFGLLGRYLLTKGAP